MYKKTSEEVLKELNTNVNGLTVDQATQRFNEYGENKLSSGKKQTLFVKFLLQFKDFLIILLLAAAIISLIVDIKEWVDSLIIFIVVVINAVLGVVQENKAEKSLEALKKLSSPMTKVKRNGNVIAIPSENVTVGDIIVIEAGDYISADARIVFSSNLSIDESSLTGESVPVNKVSDVIEKDSVPLGDQKNMVFSSTYVATGRGEAVVTSIGMKTEIGKIANLLMETTKEQTPLQHKLDQIAKVVGMLCIGICIIVFIMEKLAGMSYIDSFKTAIALAVAAIPEGLATVVTIVLSIGVTKMAKHQAIVKKLPAVETLGCTSIVCSDKTGTLTQNKMTVEKVYTTKYQELNSLNDEAKKMLSYFALCSDAKVSIIDGKEMRVGDPTELALIDVNNKYGLNINDIERVGDLPFDSGRKLMTVVIPYNKGYMSITKGAPDVVIKRSKKSEALEKGLNENEKMAKEALRVLGIGVKYYDSLMEISEEELEYNLEFLGLVGMIDPAREEVKDAISLAKKAGIKTIMITGDHVVTAMAIARKLGIMEEDSLAISSDDFHNLSDEEFMKDLEKYRVFARVNPSDKVRIIEAYKEKGYVVSMTGDGVNDAPALKKADIGCAMGITGTDVAKEASSMILTDDNFKTIIEAIYQGRGIYNNIKKCVKYLLSSNIGEVLTIFVASLIGLIIGKELGVPLLPVHLLWINLITDSLPAFALGMEEPEEGIMSLPPRPKQEGFFANGLWSSIIIEGAIIGLLTLVAFFIGSEESIQTGQTMAFLTLALTQLFHSFNMKSDTSIINKKLFKNKFLLGAFAIGFLLQLLIVYVPFLSDIFKFAKLDFSHLLISLGLAFSIIIIMEIYKFIKKIIKKIRK